MTLPAIMLLLTSCVYDDYEIPVISDDAHQYLLTITLDNSSVATRSETHQQETGTIDENYINIAGKDFSVLIFDDLDNYVTTLTPDNFNINNAGNAVNSNYTEYRIVGKIPNDLVEENLKNKFKVLVLANWNSYDSRVSYPTLSSSSTNYSLSTLWKDDVSYNFNYQNAWKPSVSQKKCIPMFGIAESILGFAEPDENTGESHLSVTVPMLRSLAKVEIKSNSSNLYINGNTSKPVTLSSASISHHNETGRLIPDIIDNPYWSESDKQVSKVTLPANGLSPIDQPAAFLQVGNELWAYIPEMNLPGKIDESSRPSITLNIKSKGWSTGSYDNNFTINFCEYDGIDPIAGTEYTQILRNHIYRIIIDDVWQAEEAHLNLRIGICPWENETISVPDFL